MKSYPSIAWALSLGLEGCVSGAHDGYHGIAHRYDIVYGLRIKHLVSAMHYGRRILHGIRQRHMPFPSTFAEKIPSSEVFAIRNAKGIPHAIFTFDTLKDVTDARMAIAPIGGRPDIGPL
jgi:hypothetical protein